MLGNSKCHYINLLYRNVLFHVLCIFKYASSIGVNEMNNKLAEGDKPSRVVNMAYNMANNMAYNMANNWANMLPSQAFRACHIQYSRN